MNDSIIYPEDRIRRIVRILWDGQSAFKDVIKNNMIGVAVAIAYGSPNNHSEIYKKIFRFGITKNTLMFARQYALFIVYCKIYKHNIFNIVNLGRKYIEDYE